MPIPGSIIDDIVSPKTALQSGAFPSTVTFLKPTITSDASGQQIRTPFVAVDGNHTNVPCRKAPYIDIRPQEQEVHKVDGVQEQANFKVVLDRWFGDLDLRWRAVIDGITFEIKSIEEDGQKVMSRMKVAVINPYNA